MKTKLGRPRIGKNPRVAIQASVDMPTKQYLLANENVNEHIGNVIDRLVKRAQETKLKF